MPDLNAQSFDTLIIGAGSMGMSAGYHLARAGNRVLMLDAGDPPHDTGAHHGSTRLIRHAYGEGAAYVPLALRAQALWTELEQETGTPLFVRTGVANIGLPGERFLDEVRRSALRYGLALETLDGREAHRRWPAWRLADEHIVHFEPKAGVLYCERAIGACRKLALMHGAALRTNATVTRIESHASDSVEVVTRDGERFRAQALIVCAGKWTPTLLAPLGMALPVTRVRKSFAWFESAPDFGPDRFPGFAVTSAAGQFYGFPDLDGEGLKVGRHDGGQPVAAEAGLAPFGAEPTDLGDLQDFLAQFIPGAGALRMGRACEYDVTPDEHFIIDTVPACPNIHVATGFSGHGFKFASAIGEALAARIVEGASRVDLSYFSYGRFV
ncbi:N-methyl-L-tryptophan oxidase [Paraburkholderia sp. J63]|uniref:N-methyl-L-tryptophan oxidase n=1 Tax=Paraburkholderia sp. J63 TaxID=2805434 RepID=UPI002ABE1F83|nr:N-methyl-L-tryptophan oxidase [Paraburkholderia sp. J63]